MDALDGPDGETLYVDRSDGDTGTKGAINVVYRDADRERRWGYFCATARRSTTRWTRWDASAQRLCEPPQSRGVGRRSRVAVASRPTVRRLLVWYSPAAVPIESLSGVRVYVDAADFDASCLFRRRTVNSMASGNVYQIASGTGSRRGPSSHAHGRHRSIFDDLGYTGRARRRTATGTRLARRHWRGAQLAGPDTRGRRLALFRHTHRRCDAPQPPPQSAGRIHDFAVIGISENGDRVLRRSQQPSR